MHVYQTCALTNFAILQLKMVSGERFELPTEGL